MPTTSCRTLVRAWRRRTTFDPARGTARAWLVAILFDQARRRRVRARPAAPTPLEPVGPPTETRLDVEEAVRALPRRQREVVTLFYLADLGVADVARVLGIGVGSVKSHLSAAREALRVGLESS